MKRAVFCILVLLATSTAAQQWVTGRVLTADSLKPIADVHVINKNLLKGTLTNARGEFEIQAHPFDTLVYSNISFQYGYSFLGEVLPGKGYVVTLKKRDFMLEEVSIFAYELTSNQDKQMPLGEPLVPMNKDITPPRKAAPPTLANPVDYLYELFGNKPKQLRELERLMEQEYYRARLEEGNNRKILKQLTGLNDAELEAFVFFCKFSETAISHQTDYELLISLLLCFDEYQQRKELEDVLERR